MKLMTRFNLILLLIFGTAGVVVSYLAHGFLNNSARRVVLQQAELMMANAQAVREYTSSNIEPLLRQGEFQPGTDADAAVSEIANLAMADLRRLPQGTLPPVVLKFDASSLPVCLVTLK